MTPTVTDRQRKILQFISESMLDRGYPPSVREICTVVGLTSTSSVQHQLRQLEMKGFIRRDPQVSRGLRLMWGETAA